MNDLKACIIYHKDDNDGVFSAAIMGLYYTFIHNIDANNIDYIGVDYNDLKAYTYEDIESISKIYHYLTLTDISLSIDLLEFAYSLFKDDMIWIDHHAPIINAVKERKLDKCINGRLNTEHSAIYHAWEYFYHSCKLYNKCGDFNGLIEMPEIIKLLSQWDSFTFEPDKKEYVQAVNKGTTYIFNLNIEKILARLINCLAFNNYWMTMLEACYETGSILLNDEHKRMDSIIERNGDKSWLLISNDIKIPACALFIQGATNSIMFRAVSEEVKIGIVFKHNADSSWAVSIYNTDMKYDKDFHVGNWCREKYNGGGHAGAGGFIISEEQFINILKSKRI